MSTETQTEYSGGSTLDTEVGGQSVGLVEKQYATVFDTGNRLQMVDGTEIGPITVAYETYGTLSEAKDNAIFICQALTGDAHAAGRYQAEDRKPGWWDALIGPGCGLDTSKYFVICANVLGGCQGTTGPRSVNPQTSQPYGLEFPFLTISDIVKVHAEFIKQLGIEKLLSAIGGSLGGMQVLDWTAQFPDMISSAIVLASSAKLNAQGIAFNAVGRRAIYADPNFNEGEYYSQEERPRFGLALARMIAHITYLSEAAIEMKFGRGLQHSDKFAYDLMSETEFKIESYLHYQGEQFVERFDANSYLYLSRAMDYFNLADSYGSLTDAFSKTQARFLVASYTTDWLFPTSQSQELVTAMINAGRHVSAIELESPYGHDAFLIEIEQLKRMIVPFLDQAYKSQNHGS